MSDYAIDGARLRCLVLNAHRLLRKKYKSSPLWAIVSDLTGHGSTASCELCRYVNLNPNQPCSRAVLEPCEAAEERVKRE